MGLDTCGSGRMAARLPQCLHEMYTCIFAPMISNLQAVPGKLHKVWDIPPWFGLLLESPDLVQFINILGRLIYMFRDKEDRT